MHRTHASQEAGRNIETAIFLAKSGFKVRLLPIDNTPNIKNPDAYFVEQDIVMEFKHNYTPTASAIENEVRDAKKQADYVLLHIKSEIDPGVLMRGLNLQIHRAKNVKEVWVIYNDQLFQFTPDEILNGTAGHKIQ